MKEEPMRRYQKKMSWDQKAFFLIRSVVLLSTFSFGCIVGQDYAEDKYKDLLSKKDKLSNVKSQIAESNCTSRVETMLSEIKLKYPYATWDAEVLLQELDELETLEHIEEPVTLVADSRKRKVED